MNFHENPTIYPFSKAPAALDLLRLNFPCCSGKNMWKVWENDLQNSDLNGVLARLQSKSTDIFKYVYTVCMCIYIERERFRYRCILHTQLVATPKQSANSAIFQGSNVSSSHSRHHLPSPPSWHDILHDAVAQPQRTRGVPPKIGEPKSSRGDCNWPPFLAKWE